MKQKVNSLQAVRGIAFLAVFFTHCEVIFNMGGGGEFLYFLCFPDFLWRISIVIEWKDSIQYRNLSNLVYRELKNCIRYISL